MGFTVVEKEGSPAELRIPKVVSSSEPPRLASPTWPTEFDVAPRWKDNARRKKNGSSVRIDGIDSEPVLKVTILKRPISARINVSPRNTSSRPRKSYEQRRKEYAQARLRILGSSE